MKKALIVLAEGFEEVEAITPIDVLRRSQVEVTIAGVGNLSVKSTRGLEIKTDILFSDYNDTPDVIILPGGMPGAENLASSLKLKDLIVKLNKEGKLLAAICASPALVFAPMGILSGKKATCYPGLEKNFSTDVKFTKDKVIKDGNIITSRGPGTALLFSREIAKVLVGEEKADMVLQQMLFSE